MTRQFIAWQRTGLNTQTLPAPDGTLSVDLGLGYGPGRDDSVSLSLWTAGHVAGLGTDAVAARVPAPHSTDATPGSLAWITFADPTLPWALPVDDRATPWLALLCLPEDLARIDANAMPGPRLVLEPGAAAYLPDQAVLPLLAHGESAGDELEIARIFAPTRLRAGRRYVCALVPTTAAGRERGLGRTPETAPGIAWSAGEMPMMLPAYASWSFRTGTRPSFEDVVAELTPVPASDARAHAQSSPDTTGILGLPKPARVTLRSPFAAPGPLPAPDPALADGLARRLETSPTNGDGLGLPAYGRRQRGSGQTMWFDTINADPGLRLAAGLGARIAADMRDDIADFATRTIGSVVAANQLLARARAARVGRERGWQRLLGPANGRSAEFLAIVAPALHRTAHDAAGGEASFAARLRATAARTVSDPATRVALRGPLARAAAGRGWQEAPGPETAPVLEEILAEIEKRHAKSRAPGGKLLLDPDGDFTGAETQTPVPADDPLSGMDSILERIKPQTTPVTPEMKRTRAAFERARRGRQFSVGRSVERTHAGDLARDVHVALGPRVTIHRRISARIKLDPRLGDLPADLSQIRWEPPWPTPLIPLLAGMNPALVAPAAATLKPGDVTLLELDAAMLEAVLAGANHAAVSDLIWRRFPVRPSMSPVRRLFPRARISGTDHDAFDAPPLRAWGGDAGANLQGRRTASPPRTILLLRLALFDMYPSAQLYAARAVLQNGRLVPSSAPGDRVFASAFGALDRGIAYAGFRLDPDTMAGDGPGGQNPGWFLIFQGPDGDGGFSLPAEGPNVSWDAMGGDIITADGLGAGVSDGAIAANALLDRPLTIALHASRLMGSST